jgi:CzcA family heavy metal efflux pump
MKRLVDWLDANHVAISFTLLVFCALSVFFYTKLPKDVFPDSEFPRFQVIADIGFASLETTELNVTRPLEDTLKTVPDVQEVRSVTERGTSTIDVYLKWGTDMAQAQQYIQARIGQVRGALPAGVDITTIKMTTSAYPMSEYGIWSDKLDLKDLYSYMRYTVLPKAIGVEGVASLNLIGGEEPEIWVKLDPRKLLEYNLDTSTIDSAIDNANKLTFIGTVTREKNSMFVVGGDKLATPQDIGNVVIATRMGRAIKLADVAQITPASADLRRIVSINGHKGIFIDVLKQNKADGLALSKALDEKLFELQKESGGRFNLVKWDLTDFVRSSIRGILTDIIAAIFIILVIVYYVMVRLRYSLPVMIVLPLVLLLEFLVLKIFGQSVNIMTLGGLSAAIGIIADNAIVITENYVRFRAEGRPGALAASMSYIVPITVWATAVSIIVFVPLNTLSGVPGLFFKPLAFTLASTIIISLIMAVLVLPVLVRYFIEGAHIPEKEEERKLFVLLKKLYLKVLDFALARRAIVLFGCAAVVAAGVFVFTKIPTGFLPDWDEGDIVFDYIAHTGLSIQSVDEIMTGVEGIIAQVPEAQMYVRKTGTHLSAPFAAPTEGEIIILLKKDRKRSTDAIMDDLRDKVAEKYPDLDTDFHQILPDRLGDLTGEAKPIVVSVTGNDFNQLWKVAHDIKDRLSKVDGLNGVIVDMPAPQPEVRLTPDQSRLALLGLAGADAFKYSQLALYGEVVSNFQRGMQLIPIREMYAGGFRSAPSGIPAIPVYTPNGGVLPLGKFMKMSQADQFPETHHKNGALVVAVNAEISDRPLSDVVRDIKATLAGLENDSYSIELEGSYKQQQTSFAELLFVLAVSIVLILMFLLFIFESWLTSLAVFLGTVASASFVIFGLKLSKVEFDVSSFTGMITVMGIVVNNGILVIDFAERFKKTGGSAVQALRSACALRFRPVLITNLAAIAGFLPMALNLGSGGEVLRPFSVAMISGLVGSMFFSLIVMPVFYAALHGGDKGEATDLHLIP